MSEAPGCYVSLACRAHVRRDSRRSNTLVDGTVTEIEERRGKARRVQDQPTYRDIDHKIPHFAQRPRREMINTFEPFKDRPSHEKGLREPEDIFMIEDSRGFGVNLFVDAQQCSV